MVLAIVGFSGEHVCPYVPAEREDRGEVYLEDLHLSTCVLAMVGSVWVLYLVPIIIGEDVSGMSTLYPRAVQENGDIMSIVENSFH